MKHDSVVNHGYDIDLQGPFENHGDNSHRQHRKHTGIIHDVKLDGVKGKGNNRCNDDND